MISRLVLAGSIAVLAGSAFAAAEVEFGPGAASKSFRKVLVAPPHVEFQRRFLEDTQSARGARHGRARVQEAEDLAHEIGQTYREALAAAFRRHGFEVVPAAGADVLTLSPSLKEVYVNRPTDPPVTFHYFVREAGEARMLVEGRDAAGARVLHATRQAKAGETAEHQPAGDASNRAGFQSMLRAWAEDLASAVAAGK